MRMSYRSRSMVRCRWQQSQGSAQSSAAHPAHQLQPVSPAHTPRNAPGVLRLYQLWLQPLGWGCLPRLLLLRAAFSSSSVGCRCWMPAAPTELQPLSHPV